MQTISFFDENPLFDLLPVLKTKYYSGGFKPLMYLRAAAVQNIGFAFDFMKFERNPAVSLQQKRIDVEADSCVAISLRAGGELLTVLANSAGSIAIYQNGRANSSWESAAKSVFLYKGADEQGWYWGVRFTVEAQLIRKVASDREIAPGFNFFANAYALQASGKSSHFGAVAPIVTADIFSVDNLARFVVI